MEEGFGRMDWRFGAPEVRRWSLEGRGGAGCVDMVGGVGLYVESVSVDGIEGWMTDALRIFLACRQVT